MAKGSSKKNKAKKEIEKQVPENEALETEESKQGNIEKKVVENNREEVKQENTENNQDKTKKVSKTEKDKRKKKKEKIRSKKEKAEESKEQKEAEQKVEDKKKASKNNIKDDENVETESNKTEKEENSEDSESKEQVKLIKFEEIKNIFRKKKDIPKQDKKTIRKPVIQNVLVAIIIIIYFAFLVLGFYRIDNVAYQTDLKVFAICILLFAIILLEKAYKEDSGKIAIFGIETIFVAVITLALIYVNLMLSSNYINIVLIITGVIAIYYIIKSVVIYIKGRNKYFVNDMKEMINTEE